MATKKKPAGRSGGTATGNESRGYEKISEANLTPSMRRRLEQIRGGAASEAPMPMLGDYKRRPAKKK